MDGVLLDESLDVLGAVGYPRSDLQERDARLFPVSIALQKANGDAQNGGGFGFAYVNGDARRHQNSRRFPRIFGGHGRSFSAPGSKGITIAKVATLHVLGGLIHFRLNQHEKRKLLLSRGLRGGQV